jgi:hypothetical protein
VKRRLVLELMVVLGLLAGCGTTVETTPAGSPPAEPAGDLLLGCVGIAAIPCQGVADIVTTALPPGRGRPASLQLSAEGCGDVACPPGTIAGLATAEWADGGEPVVIQFQGPPASPHLIVVIKTQWSGVIQPKSVPVLPGAVVRFTLGHCGLLHEVDFDGSFWVPVGQVDPDDPATINSDEGQMRLIAPNRAQYASGGRLIATLARFPGPKHFRVCD